MQISFNKQLSARFNKVMQESPAKVAKGITIALGRCGDQLRNDAIDMSPYKTGNLRRSITKQMVTPKTVVVGSNLDYARIHDEGGTITARRAKYLTFKINGQWVRVRSVRIPKYRGRGYLTPAFEKVVKDAPNFFMEEINRAIK